MKIRVKKADYSAVMARPAPKHRAPWKFIAPLRAIVALVARVLMLPVGFRSVKKDLDKVDGPCLVLMNHSSFIDLEIAAALCWKRPYSIVATTDAFVGLGPILRLIGCIPTQKFVTDMALLSDMVHALRKNRADVIMFPEAGYSFDGTATALPRKLGVLLKKLDVPVVHIQTWGAFARQPLYNLLKLRKVQVTAEMRCLLTREQVREMSVQQLDEAVEQAFGFDQWAWQRENKIRITEPDRAEGLERVLYQCPVCGKEGHMKGSGTGISCGACGAHWELDEYGVLQGAQNPYPHVPDWFAWQRSQVRQQLEEGTYGLDLPVEIGLLRDTSALYMVGEGRLTHGPEGFALTGCGGELHYAQGPRASHTVNCDFYWYQIQDVIGIGDRKCQYFCFPKEPIPVAKVRLAAEELYKMSKKRAI